MTLEELLDLKTHLTGAWRAELQARLAEDDPEEIRRLERESTRAEQDVLEAIRDAAG